MTATKTAALMPGCVGICGRRRSSPPAHFKMSRWPSSPGGGLQNRAGERNSHTGLHFASIGVERYTPVFQTGIQGALP